MWTAAVGIRTIRVYYITRSRISGHVRTRVSVNAAIGVVIRWFPEQQNWDCWTTAGAADDVDDVDVDDDDDGTNVNEMLMTVVRTRT